MPLVAAVLKAAGPMPLVATVLKAAGPMPPVAAVLSGSPCAQPAREGMVVMTMPSRTVTRKTEDSRQNCPAPLDKSRNLWRSSLCDKLLPLDVANRAVATGDTYV
jgi:hypothetical protein